MMAWARTMRPPAPTPWTKREPISVPMFIDRPEATDDRGEGGGDDRLVDRRQQHAQHQAAENDEHLAMGEATESRRGLGEGRGGGAHGGPRRCRGGSVRGRAGSQEV